MPACLAVLLACLISINAAYAATVGICDALEHGQPHALHLGHHSHEHDHNHDTSPTDPDGPDQLPVVGDHHHVHVHPSFFTLLLEPVGVMLFEGSSPRVAVSISNFVSAPPVRLERPPQSALV